MHNGILLAERGHHNLGENIQLIRDSVHVVEQLFPNKVIHVFDKDLSHSRYVSENGKDLWGLSIDKLMALSLEDLHNNIHPDDFREVARVTDRIREYGESEDARYIFNYRIKIQEEVIPITEERITLRGKCGKAASVILFGRRGPECNSCAVTLEVFQMMNNRLVSINKHVFNSEEQKLSSRETDIVKLIAKGLTNQQIAERLSLSIFTVKNHKQRLFKKLDMKSSFELMKYAFDNQLIQ
ncbi:hypothetical protein WSM22_40900 [Cytophagales bacterium WSM2-2]|nr:hypothetical protein WSM22_40900 [Cytophagales bacterium WSM2-2]